MPIRHLPNDPDLDRLEGKAKSLLAAYRSGDPAARSDFEEFHPRGVEVSRRSSPTPNSCSRGLTSSRAGPAFASRWSCSAPSGATTCSGSATS